MAGEMLLSSNSDYLYKIGDKVTLTGLVYNTHDEGKVLTISGYRRIVPNAWCESGRGYYFEEYLDWADYVYEERLKPVETPLLKAELEALAKLCARQPHALQLKEYFNLCFAEERSRVIYEELKGKREKAVSVTALIHARS